MGERRRELLEPAAERLATAVPVLVSVLSGVRVGAVGDLGEKRGDVVRARRAREIIECCHVRLALGLGRSEEFIK